MAQKRRKAVLKDFSQLQPVDKRIELLAAGIYQIVFRGEANNDFEPKKQTQVHRVWKMAKLDERMQIAWQTFCDDVYLANGKSGSVTSAYGEYTDKGDGSDFRIPTAYANSYYRRLERLLTDYLSREERALIVDLLQDTLKGTGNLQIEAIGLVRSGYSDKASARAAGVAHVQNLLTRLAGFYGI